MESIQKLKDNIFRAFKGKEEIVELALVTLVSGGHLLLEDVPGVGKTTLAKALAKSISGRFTRIQLTPDMLPSDILGVSIYSPKSQEFEYKEGPIFTNILLADELNRTSPRTQASLLEAMNERQVSIEGTPTRLQSPFMVVATQNPYEFDGTYPLPESQLDRFLLRVSLGYPSRETEREILRHESLDPARDLEPVMTGEEVLAIQEKVRQVKLTDELLDYILAISQASRENPEVLGISPRGSLALRRASQGLAFLRERDFCTPDDVREVALSVIAHRMVFKSRSLQRDSRQFLQEMIDTVPVPK